MAKYVVSLGGNALGNNAEEQKQALVKVAEAISDLIIAKVFSYTEMREGFFIKVKELSLLFFMMGT